MKIKDALVGFLFWLGILAFTFLVMSADSLPMWVLLILAALAWVFYILVIIRDYQREKNQKPTFYVKTPRGLMPLDVAAENRRQAELYDQEADK